MIVNKLFSCSADMRSDQGECAMLCWNVCKICKSFLQQENKYRAAIMQTMDLKVVAMQASSSHLWLERDIVVRLLPLVQFSQSNFKAADVCGMMKYQQTYWWFSIKNFAKFLTIKSKVSVNAIKNKYQSCSCLYVD